MTTKNMTTLHIKKYILLFIIISQASIAAMSDHFVMTWDPSSTGISEYRVLIPINSNYQYSYDVDWNNDGIFDDFGITTNAIHTYDEPGIKTIRVQGQFPAIKTGESTGYSLLSIEQWGTYPWQTMNSAFRSASNLKNNASDTPNLSQCTNLSYMFKDASKIGNVNESANWNWDTSNITNMTGVFRDATDFNQDIGMWDTSKVTNMAVLFFSAESFNQNIGSWDTSSVIDMSYVFDGAKSFNQDIGNWDTSNVTNMQYLFGDAESINQNIGSWDTSNVTSMKAMFAGAESFNQNIGLWDTTKVTTMRSMFSNAKSFNQDISQWNTSNVETMRTMFSHAESFNQAIGLWKTTTVTDFSGMFQAAFSFNQDLSSWDTSSATLLWYMFSQAESFNQDISSWDTSNATHFSYMFQKALSFDQDLSQWNVENAIVMTEMFRYLTLSIQQYDALLVGWGSQNLQPDVSFGAGYSIYCSAAAQAAHENMTSQFNWDISDGGVCSSQLNIISKNRIFTDENQTFATQVITTDPDFDTVTYAITGGEDQALFSIDSVSGIINFVSLPDYENPHDENTDNYYHIEITATDNSLSQETDSQALTIIVRNVFENMSNDHFVTTWDTEIDGSVNTNNTSITIPVSYDENSYYNVDWDNDGIFDEFGITESITHDFGTPGIKTIRISGGLPALYFKDNYDSTKLISIDQWGTFPWQSMYYSFSNTSNLINNATDIPNLTECGVLSYAFSGASLIGGQSETSNWDWDIANIKMINSTFLNANIFNQDISHWDVNQVFTLESTFSDASHFNQDISLWGVSNVSNMNSTFSRASKFDQAIGNWNTSKVTDMSFLFYNAFDFNQDIGNWNTNRVTDMSYLFYQAESFNQDIGQWNVESVEKEGVLFDDTGFKRMLTGTNLSIINYDALLVGWSNQNIIQNHYFFAGDNLYCSSDARLAHERLTTDYNWTIYDGGQCADTLNILTESYQGHEENTTLVVQIETSDPEFDTVTYSLNAEEDMAFFNIDPVSGVLSFNNPPDFESPMDANNDNIYWVKVRATDDGSPIETVTKVMSIAISDVFEGMDSEYFITTWNTELPGDSNNTSISLLAGSYHDYHVDWDNDGTIDEFNITSDVIHDFGTPGIKTIRITGKYPYFQSDDKQKFISIDQWGSNPWDGLYFSSASNLVNKAADIPNLVYVTSLSNAFSQASSIGGINDSGNWNWKTNSIKYMSGMFKEATVFNKDLSSWDTKQVRDMSKMFSYTSAFNKDISLWNTEQVTNMSDMFKHAYSFNQDIGQWNTSKVTNMSSMFHSAYAFNQDIGQWNTSEVSSMTSMFANADFFNQDIGFWDTSKVESLSRMFYKAISFDQNLGLWNVENSFVPGSMFEGARLSIANYDALLIGWSSQDLVSIIHTTDNFSAGNSIYCSQAAQIAHAYIESTFNWDIEDAGVCAPELNIISNDTIEIDENHTGVIKVLVSDPDFDTATFSLSGGNDMSLFTIDRVTGLLSFRNPPDYENPISFDGSNTYQVEVQATDNGSPQETATQLITVSVRDLTETDPVDLDAQLIVDSADINPGDSIQITITISNIGAHDAINAIVFDVLPIDFENSYWSCQSTGTANCSNSGSGEIFNTVNIPNDGSSIIYTLTTTISNSPSEIIYKFLSETSEPQYDIDLSNNIGTLILFDTIYKNGFEAP